MSRLIVISNRVAAATGGNAGSQGGLAVALTSALRECRGLWFGWSGEVTEEFTGQITFQRDDDVTTATVDLEEQDVEEYYDGYANRTLWPLFHYRIDLAEYERGFAGGYQRVNERFAETIAPLIEPDDAVWVQDYHMIPLGTELRKRGCRNRIGFFLHTPWPPRRLLLTLPEASDLVETMFAYDVIGFHTDEWLQSFVDFVVLESGGSYADGILRLGDRQIRLITCPIGIDCAEFRSLAESPEAIETFNQMRDSAANRAMMVGVDRLDYSKGLEERFLGYERFLVENPAERKEVFLLQIAPPSRGTVESYQRIRSSLEGLSGRINGAHADLDWVPIRYVNQGYSRAVLAGVYRAARMALVTPLRDGMNLVAKEFVAAQDPEDPGVLILSRFAGAAVQLKDALLVNPYSAEEVSDAIRTALAMGREERIARWRAMFDNIREQDVLWWRRRFTDALFAATPPLTPEPLAETA
ncbi:alpha,alpha-trehalose-phosphate synthase (UDP-forming) [Sphingomonas astaxanthinifaciens]|uniref:Alpha,alpha-trehalose-phosphate synthase (UDP-forming) n=1 Tax=Sphingomonas astaxanthinifaciens DSM 22298 TaxID=1123267 RepID=A0ABQ5Z4Z3_9SPHN|nr:trehalose-6-phosphate synthase [Sphingomonas astaxanthinifaciens]GLR47076.1 alpha,alpha-trehalose-phosphate synthase (UDP-forming) [Sphingomonas astaxanthinifaciens DSM 22298]